MDARPNGPCKDCLNRFLGCHATCDIYKEWKVRHEADNKAKAYNKNQHNNFNPILRDRWLQSRMKKKK